MATPAGSVVYAEETTAAGTADTAQKSQPAVAPVKEIPKKQDGLTAALVTDKAALKKIETKHTETQNQIKEAVVEIDKTKLEALRLTQEKKVAVKEAEAKTQEAVMVQAEAKAAMSQAEVTGDDEARKKAKALSLEAQKLAVEAKMDREKAKVLDLKAQVSQEKVTADLAAMQAMENELESLRQEKYSRTGLIDKALRGGVIILIGFILLWCLGFGIKRFEMFVTEKDVLRESEKTLQLKTLSALFKWSGSLIVFGVVIYMFFENFGIDMAPLLAGAGIVGLAFGFGGQYLIRDIINGIFILVEGQYRINDVIKIGDTGGLVESVNLRMTKLRDLEGRVIYIPNGEIKKVINYTQDYAQALLNIGVAYKENVDHVIVVIKEVAKGMQEDPHFGRLILAEFEMLGVDDFADSQVTIKCRFKTLPIKQWEVSREFRRRLKNKFDEVGIEIPFPHRTLYWGAGQENQWLKEMMQARVAGSDLTQVGPGLN